MFGGGLDYLTQAMKMQPQGGLAVSAPVPMPAPMPMTFMPTSMPTPMPNLPAPVPMPAPMQGGLTAAAPITRFDQITPEMYSDMIMKLRAQAAPDFAVDSSLPVPTGIGDFFFSTPEKLAAYRQSGAEYEARTPQFNLFGDKENETETATVRPRQGAAGYQLFSNGQVIGEARSNEELSRLVEEANRLGVEQGKLANIRINEIPTQGSVGQNLYTNAPEPPSQFGEVLKFAAPAVLTALSAGLLAKPLALALGAKAGVGGALTGGLLGAGKTIGTGLAAGLGSTAGNLAIGKPLGQSLTSGALSGLTAGALSGLGVGQPGGFLGSAKGSSLASTLAENLGPEGITVLANKLPSIVPTIVSGASGALSNALPSEGGVGAPGAYIPPIPPTEVPGLSILANKFPTSAVPGLAGGVSGISQTALDILTQQPQLQAPQKQAPTEMDEIVVTGRPDAPIVTSAFPFPPINLAGITSTIPDLAVRPDVAPMEEAATTDDEIVVTGRPDAPIVTSALPFKPIFTGFTPTIPDLAVRPDVAPVEQAAKTDDEIGVLANRYDAIPTGDLANLPSVIAEAIAQKPQLSNPNEMLVEANPIDDPTRVPPVNLFEQLQKPTTYDDTTDPAEREKTPLQKALTTGGRILTGLSFLGGLAGGGGRNTSGLGTGAAAIGTRASLDPVFGGQLPPARGTFAPGARAPRVMNDIDYERYGYGPARSFFENVPETPEQYRAALAANAPRPIVADAGTVGVPNFLSNFIPPTASSPAVQAVRRLAPGVSDAQIEAFLATPEGADFLAALQEAETPQGVARGGAMAVKGRGKPSRDSYAVNGVGDGRSDEIPALLSDGEYVIDAETVAMLGNGSGKAGAKQLDDLRVKIRKHKGRNLAKGRFSDNAKAPEKYLSGGRT